MAHFILDEQDRYQLTGAQLEELLLLSIDKNHLFYGIGEAGTDSVFMRSFSSLMIPLLFIADAKRPGVSENVARRVLHAVLTYARQERDWRGYVKGKGWAHSVAHLSDALDDCAKNRYWSQVPAIAEQKAGLLADIDQALQKLNSLPPAWFAGENENAIV